jgi:hypothetical protein
MSKHPSPQQQKRMFAYIDTSDAIVKAKPTDNIRFRYTIPRSGDAKQVDSRSKFEVPDPRTLNIPKITVKTGSITNIAREHNNHGKPCIMHNIDASEVLKNCRCGKDLPGLDIMIISSVLNVLTAIEYPISENDIVYSSKVLIFKDEENFEYLQQPFSCDIVSIDTPILEKKRNLTKQEVKVLTNKLRTSFIQMYLAGVEYPILSPLGCGGYNLNQEEVCNIFHQLLILERASAFFKKVIFVTNDNTVKRIYKDKFEPTFVSVNALNE